MNWVCPECGAPMVYRRSRFGKFLGCSRYPECKHTLKKDGKEKKQAEPVGLKCPQRGCEGELVWREGRGKRFIGCSRYPKCRFSVFGDKEAETPCPKCGHPWTMGSKRGRQRIWHCVACNHEHKEFAAETKASEPHVAEQSEV